MILAVAFGVAAALAADGPAGGAGDGSMEVASAGAPAGEGFGLAYDVPSSVSIAVSPLGPAPEEIPIKGPFRLAGVVDGTRAYEAANPVRPRALFYERQPPEMEMLREGRKLGYVADPAMRGLAGSWEVNAESVVVRVMETVPRPKDGVYALRYPPATAREESLRFRGGDGAEWAVRSLQLDEVTRHGVLLPAPSSIAWTVHAPPGAHLRLDAAVIPPEIEEGLASDGATLEVRVDGEVIATFRAEVARFQKLDVALPKSGAMEISFVTSDADTTVDHVFVASPNVYVPKANPKRVIFAFIDTLRRDHMGTYGYARDTTPKLDSWAKDAVVFEEARTVAPWTLPSTRALLTGRQPEWWSEGTTLQEALAARGWATGAFVGNVYLSSNFEMDRGWGEHACVNWPGAAYETGKARNFLDRHPTQDAIAMVHFMDLHLPYKEPSRYRKLWVQREPDGLEPYFNRTILMREAMRQREILRPYLIDRYDQNLRYVDDELSAFFAELPGDATVVLFADHGEEFFDHGDVEHGHTLHDELLRVPLIVKSPGLAPRRVDGAVSLLDVAPTLLDLLDLPADLLGSPEGSSLRTLATTGVDSALTSRPQAFGRVLYGPEQWGSYANGEKYISTHGKERLYDLEQDPSEQNDLASEGANLDAGRRAIAEALGRDLVQAFRVSPLGRPGRPIEVEMIIPGGVARAWVGDDPTTTTLAVVESAEGDVIKMRFESKLRENREIFLLPNRPAEEVARESSIRVIEKNSRPQPLRARPQDGTGAVLARSRAGPSAAVVTWAIVPLPAGETTPGSNLELQGALEALGYAVPSEPGEAAPEEDEEEAEPDPTDDADDVEAPATR